MPSIMLINLVGISKRSEKQSTIEDEPSSLINGHVIYESKAVHLNQNLAKIKTQMQIFECCENDVRFCQNFEFG